MRRTIGFFRFRVPTICSGPSGFGDQGVELEKEEAWHMAGETLGPKPLTEFHRPHCLYPEMRAFIDPILQRSKKLERVGVDPLTSTHVQYYTRPQTQI